MRILEERISDDITLQTTPFIKEDGELITLYAYEKRVGNRAISHTGTLEGALVAFGVWFEVGLRNR